MPTDPTMGADEVLTWIAFRRAVAIDSSPRGGSWQRTIYKLSRSWPFSDMALYAPRYAKPLPLIEWFGSPQSMLAALTAKAAGHDFLKCTVPAWNEQAVMTHTMLAALLGEVHATELAEALRADLAQVANVNRQIRHAEREAQCAVQEGRLRLLGSGPSGGERHILAPDEWHFGVEMFPDGTLREVGNPQVLHTQLLFETAEVLRNWPLEVKQPEAADPTRAVPTPLLPATDDSVAQWMIQHASEVKAATGRPPKRDDAIAECRRVNHCNTTKARAAWNGMPSDLRRPAPTPGHGPASRRESDGKRTGSGHQADGKRMASGR